MLTGTLPVRARSPPTDRHQQGLLCDAEPVLIELLRNLGPPDRKTTPAYPFHHLQKRWDLHHGCAGCEDLGASCRTKLRGSGPTGQLPTKFEAALREDARLVAMLTTSA